MVCLHVIFEQRCWSKDHRINRFKSIVLMPFQHQIYYQAYRLFLLPQWTNRRFVVFRLHKTGSCWTIACTWVAGKSRCAFRYPWICYFLQEINFRRGRVFSRTIYRKYYNNKQSCSVFTYLSEVTHSCRMSQLPMQSMVNRFIREGESAGFLTFSLLKTIWNNYKIIFIFFIIPLIRKVCPSVHEAFSTLFLHQISPLLIYEKCYSHLCMYHWCAQRSRGFFVRLNLFSNPATSEMLQKFSRDSWVPAEPISSPIPHSILLVLYSPLCSWLSFHSSFMKLLIL